ncbi:baseplate assembly protein [Methylotenera oryzisoli]|uniref:Baseplate assembly protein n=1 Tax=Methylotenera oryzisoli TaxID=2080758 RepID=A0A4Y9VR74_9PROT|nr:baseplate J/gp47 family protein [Methylotenera oryzisoli]TFW71515.1 baseplate assembly protein [Methylotenera oryzisoli]
MTVAINLSELPAPSLIEDLDFESILQDYKDQLILLAPECAETLTLESEPLVKLMQLAAWRELRLKARYNDEAKAVLLAYSSGPDLDHIGFTYYRGELRLVITEADPDAFPPVEQVMESDTDFRNRLALKPESYSCAGPSEAYKFHALSAHGMVKDAFASSPVPGTSLVTVLSREGQGVPSQPILDAVEARVNPNNIRPMCEEVIVQAAEIITYTLNVGLKVYKGPDHNLIVSASNNAVANYIETSRKLGVSHTIAGFHKAAKQEGVWDVTLNISENITVADHQAAFCTELTVAIVEITG